MALPGTGQQISLNQIHEEAGGTSGTYATILDADIRALIGKSTPSSTVQLAFNEWWGASGSSDLLNTTMTIGSSSFDSISGTWSWTNHTTTFGDWPWYLKNANEGWLGSGNLYGFDGTAGGDYYADGAWGAGGDPVSGEEIFLWDQNPDTMGSMGSTSVSGRTISYLYRSTYNGLYLGLESTTSFSFNSLIVNGQTFTSATATTAFYNGDRYYVWNSADGVTASTIPTSGSINIRIT